LPKATASSRAHKAEQLGGFRLALHRPDASVPTERIEAVIDRIGAIPQHEIPTLSWLTYTTDTYLNYIEPELKPEVCILWLCEPDNSAHFCGLGSEPNCAAIRHADAEFGRILQWREQSEMGERLPIITMSDHGQITVAGQAVNIATGLEEAGFVVGETVSDGADAALALASAGGIYVRDGDYKPSPGVARFLRAMARAHSRMPWRASSIAARRISGWCYETTIRSMPTASLVRVNTTRTSIRLGAAYMGVYMPAS
jgi:predicted AlkP superfamily pyrophosphatase or phosphodiesterase